MLQRYFRLTRAEFILYLREPSGFFFTLIFPLLLMMLFGSIWGNEPFPGENFGYIDFAVPAFIGMVILTTGISGLTTSIAAYREKGILRRFKAAPISPLLVLTAELSSLFIITVMGMLLLLAAGVIVFGMHFYGSIPEVLFAFVLSTLSISALGFIPASLAPSARSGMIISNVMYFPMLFLSGAALPREMLPPFLKTFSQILPLTHVIELLQGLWLGGHLWDYPVQIAVLCGVTVVGFMIAAKFFRWE
ncbi:MAG: ABC transporter permease [Candidatus Aegiribacteria sp.]|nr:ABC transporter permease [Candidatus Aegiribacteria sp.]